MLVGDRVPTDKGDSGGEGKPVVVLVHGLGFGQRSWDRVAPRLSDWGRGPATLGPGPF